MLLNLERQVGGTSLKSIVYQANTFEIDSGESQPLMVFSQENNKKHHSSSDKRLDWTAIRLVGS